MDSLATLVCHDRLPIRGIGTGRLYQWLSYFLTATKLRRGLSLHARQHVRHAAESESAAAKVEKTVAALEREEAAMREQMLVP
jgi:hypothetical protein